MSQSDRHRTAWWTTGIGTAIGLFVLVFGYVLVELFKIDVAGFLIGSGLIVVVFAVRMVVLPPDSHHLADAAESPLRVAIYPLAIPLLITPPAVVTLTALGIDIGASGERLFGPAAAFLAVMAVNLGVFMVLARIEQRVPLAVWEVGGRLLGVFLAAFGVTIIIKGLAEVSL